jgi:AdoMet-dependent heme synthase
MSIPSIRVRKESFGYALAFATGEIGFYGDEVGPMLLAGTSLAELERHRIRTLPVTANFHLTAPLIVWFELTRECNLPCRHCYISAGRQRSHELSTSEVYKALEQLKDKGVFALVLVGGEPFLRPDLAAIVNYAHELGFVISIVTNGTKLTQEVIESLPREECIVCVSLDGIDSHKEMRIKTTYEETRDKLLLLKENSYPAAVVATLTNNNVGELEQLLSFAIANGFYFASTPFVPVGRGRLFPQYVPTEDVVDQAAQLYVRDCAHEEEMFSRNGLCIIKFVDNCYALAHASRREFCGVAMAYLLSDGSVFPCSLCASTGTFSAGNLRDKDFAEIWENSFTEIRQITYDDFSGCRTCEFSKPEYICTSRCPVMSQVLTDDPLFCGATPFVKASLKRRTELLS